MFLHGIELVHDTERKAKAPKKPKTMLSKLKSVTAKIIQMQRFNWNEDLLHQSFLAGKQDFLSLSTRALEKKTAEEKNDVSEEDFNHRCLSLTASITSVLFRYIERGIFARDLLTVATLLSFAVAEASDTLEHSLFLCLLSPVKAQGGAAGGMTEDVGAWLPVMVWSQIKGLEKGAVENIGLVAFEGLGDQVNSDPDGWHKWYEHPKPETQPPPGGLKSVTGISMLILLRTMRADRIPAGLQAYVASMLGPAFSEPLPFNMLDTYTESSASTPIFFVLFPGVDPTPWVELLGSKFDVNLRKGTLRNISMGQGQESPAEATLDVMAKQGGWIMLQNIQLMESWLRRLERKLELASEAAAMNFRCFLSAEPPPLPHLCNIPESLLQTCIKVANEAPADFKSNLQRAWACFCQEQLDDCNHATEFKKCLFGLCFFHALILGRRRFGQQGWSRAYGFNTGDLKICANVLTSYLDAAPEHAEGGGVLVPWDDLRYIFGEIMYGGHITDFWDRRTNVSYLQFFFNQKLLESGKHLAPGFPLPNGNLDHQEYATYIEKALPIETPVVFGLHPNAEIGYLTSTGEQILGTVLRLRKGGTSIPDGSIAVGGVREILDSLVKRQPKCFNLILTHEKAKPLLTKSVAPYVVVATQEATRMNLLVEEISRSLGELHKGLNGQLNMSQQMEDLSTALSLNEVPGRNPFHLASWEKFAWPSRKNLQHWFCDLERRIEQLVNWEERLELPRSLWMSLFNPMAFLTAVQQVVARKRSLPLDNMTISTDVTIYRRPEDLNSLINEPSDGAFIHGLFMQGARWMTVEEASAANQTRLTSGVKCAGVIVDSHAKDLLPPMPVLYVKAVSVEAEWEPTSIGYLRPNMYNCPCYYTSFRGPTYVFLATLDTEEPATKWINAGVALLLSSDDHL
tara:strand:- start:358 stop:3093 length:2736 start_codon:yes stop_codon:yes gene_type:complete